VRRLQLLLRLLVVLVVLLMVVGLLALLQRCEWHGPEGGAGVQSVAAAAERQQQRRLPSAEPHLVGELAVTTVVASVPLLT
jgi:Flp pilus assembly protein CpaB